MGSKIALRSDFTGADLRRLARFSKHANQTRRLLALAAIYDGDSRTTAAKIGGVGLQIVRDWVLRFNDRGPDALIDGKSPGPPFRLNDMHRQALVDRVERGPDLMLDGVVRWRLTDLAQWLLAEFSISVDENTVSRELKKLGYVKITARPRHHAQNEPDRESFKKGALSPSWQQSKPACHPILP